MDTNTLNRITRSPYADVKEPEADDLDSSVAQKIAFVLVWAAVAIPMLWGVMKAWEEVQPMF